MGLMNSYAIVAYVAGPVGRFSDRLRNDLDPGSPHHAHITILPPRPLECEPSQAIEFARQLLAQFDPLTVRLDSVAAFPHTQVVYLALASGGVELETMHDVLNTGPFAQQEAYHYVPHITLGKQLRADVFESFLAESRRRWQEFPTPDPVRIESLTFVQQRDDGAWTDVAELSLGRVATLG